MMQDWNPFNLDAFQISSNKENKTGSQLKELWHFVEWSGLSSATDCREWQSIRNKITTKTTRIISFYMLHFLVGSATNEYSI